MVGDLDDHKIGSVQNFLPLDGLEASSSLITNHESLKNVQNVEKVQLGRWGIAKYLNIHNSKCNAIAEIAI